MTLRSNLNIVRYQMEISLMLFIFGVILFSAGSLIGHELIMGIKYLVLIAGVFWLCFGFDICRYWIAFGREIQLTEEGITVRFLSFTRLYRWEQMQIKRKIRIGIEYSRYDGSEFKGILFSTRKSWFLKKHLYYYSEYAYYLPTYHPFSLVFIMFEPRLSPLPKPPRRFPEWMKKNWNPKWRTQGEESGYFADEEQLLSMLEDWGVSLEGIYKYLIY